MLGVGGGDHRLYRCNVALDGWGGIDGWNGTRSFVWVPIVWVKLWNRVVVPDDPRPGRLPATERKAEGLRVDYVFGLVTPCAEEFDERLYLIYASTCQCPYLC